MARIENVTVGLPPQVNSNISSGLIDVLNANQVKQQAKEDRVQASLRAYRPIAQKQDVASALKSTETDLQQRREGIVNAEYGKLKLDEAYQSGVANLDKEWSDIQSKEVTKYDSNGNPVESSANKAFFEKQAKFEEEYKGYREAEEAKIMQMNEQAKATLGADFSSTRFQKAMEGKLIDAGLGLDTATSASTKAAAKYKAAPMTEIQKIAAEAKIKSAGQTLKTEQEFANKAFEGNKVITNLGKSGTSLSAALKGRTGTNKMYGSTSTEKQAMDLAEKTIMRKFDDLGYGYWKDNKDIKNDYLHPLYQAYGDTFTPQEINDAILLHRDDGFWKDTLKAGTTFKKVAADLERKKLEKLYASGAGQAQYATTGRDGISNEDRQKLLTGAQARFDNSLAQIQAGVGGKANTDTGLAAIKNSRIEYNALGDALRAEAEAATAPGETSTPKGTGGSRYTKEEKKNPLVKALQSKGGDGALKTLFDKDPDKFADNAMKLEPATQSRLGKVLSGYEAGDFGTDPVSPVLPNIQESLNTLKDESLAGDATKFEEAIIPDQRDVADQIFEDSGIEGTGSSLTKALFGEDFDTRNTPEKPYAGFGAREGNNTKTLQQVIPESEWVDPKNPTKDPTVSHAIVKSALQQLRNGTLEPAAVSKVLKDMGYTKAQIQSIVNKAYNKR